MDTSFQFFLLCLALGLEMGFLALWGWIAEKVQKRARRRRYTDDNHTIAL